MSGLCWKRLQLAGFGVHDSVELELDEGLLAFIAPNESGKTTAVAGLTAVVFGLPSSRDKTSWGQERFRSQRGLSRFEGSVDFRALDGKSYRLWRNFDTHAVRLTRAVVDGYEPVFEGEHNPSARKSTGKYESYLEKLVGMTSQEVFSSTFSIRQPLTGDHRLSQEVSALLAGSGGGSHQAALKELEEQIVQRTKYTKQYGLPGNNKSKDRELEELTGSVQEVRAAIREGSAAAGTLQQVQEQLARATDKERSLRAEVERLNSAVGAGKSWLDAKDNYDREQRTYSISKQRLEDVRELEREIKRSEIDPAPLRESAERNWEFVGDRALPYVEQRRDDAPAAIGEYRHLQSILGKLNEHQTQKEQFGLLQSASQDRLAELSNEAAVQANLEREVRRAAQDLERIGAQAEAQPDTGFEDVAQLGAERLDELRKAAQPSPPTNLMLAGAGLAVGFFVGFALGLGAAGGVAVGLVLAALGFALGGRLTGAKRASRAEAQATLERYQAWQARKQSAAAPVDRQPFEARVAEAQGELEAFLERVAPYRQAYGDVGEAVSAYKSALEGANRCVHEAEEMAQRVWGVGAREVDAFGPADIAGHWRRLALFVQALNQAAPTVRALYDTLVDFDEQNTWEALARGAKAWDARQTWQQERTDQVRTRQDTLAGILRGEAVTSVAELSEKVEAQHTRAILELQKFQAVCDAHPELPRHDDPEANREKLVQAQRHAAEQLAQCQRDHEDVKEAIQELRGQRAEAQGRHPVNVAAKEVELVELESQKAELQTDIGAYALAYSTLKEAVDEYQDAYLERLSEASSSYFTEFTNGAARQVDFSANFNARITERSGVTLEPSQLSQGAQDQLALAVRLAVADMISDNLLLPLVFDDPFRNCDKDRLLRIEAVLRKIAESRQVLILSHENSYLSWGSIVRTSPGVGGGR